MSYLKSCVTSILPLGNRKHIYRVKQPPYGHPVLFPAKERPSWAEASQSRFLSSAAERRQCLTGRKELPSDHPRVSIRYLRLYFIEQWPDTFARNSVLHERERSSAIVLRQLNYTTCKRFMPFL